MGFFDNFFGNNNKTQQTTKTGPWGPTQGYLKDGMKSAEGLLTGGSGFNSYPGQGWVDFSDASNRGMWGIMGQASQGNPFADKAQGFTSGLLTGKHDIGTGGFQNLLNNPAIRTNGQLQALLSQSPNAIDMYGKGIASGAEGINTGGQYQSLFNDIDPSRDAIVNKQADRLSDDISRQFGGASFGSAGHSGELTSQVGDFRERMASNMRQQDMAQKMGVLGAMTGVQGANIGNKMNAAGMLSGEQAGAQAGQAGILGQIGNNQMSNFGAKRGVMGDIANLQQGNLQNRMSAVGMAPGVNDMQYDAYRRMLDVGGMQEGKQGEILQSQMDKFYRDDMSDWNRLTQAMGIFSGTGQQGSQTQTQVPSSGFGQMLGGGLLGLQALSGMGGFGGGGFGGGGSYMY